MLHASTMPRKSLHLFLSGLRIELEFRCRLVVLSVDDDDLFIGVHNHYLPRPVEKLAKSPLSLTRRKFPREFYT